jgi:predicted peroxiredoxin
VQTSDLPERQYAPLILAQEAKGMFYDALVFYLGQGLRVLRPDSAKAIKLGEFPSLDDVLRKTLDAGIDIYACEASIKMIGWDKVDLVPGVRMVSAGNLNDLVLDADAVMWF